MSNMSIEDWSEKYGGFVVLGLIILWVLFTWIPSTREWSGIGYVNVFPDGDNAKNYRLKADIAVSHSIDSMFWVDTSYSVRTIYWPNGGHIDFNDCRIEKGGSTDCYGDETDFTIEVAEPPENNRGRGDE